MNKKFYLLEHGWANKYFWFDIIEDFPAGYGNFIDRIKKTQLTFTKQSGTTPTDVHGSTLAIEFYSQNFVKFLAKLEIKSFDSYKIKFVPELSNIGNYYYIEWKDMLDAKKKKNDILFDLKDWKNEEIFTLKGTRFVIVTEHFKNLIKKSKLKNFEFEEIIASRGIFRL